MRSWQRAAGFEKTAPACALRTAWSRLRWIGDGPTATAGAAVFPEAEMLPGAVSRSKRSVVGSFASFIVTHV